MQARVSDPHIPIYFSIIFAPIQALGLLADTLAEEGIALQEFSVFQVCSFCQSSG